MENSQENIKTFRNINLCFQQVFFFSLVCIFSLFSLMFLFFVGIILVTSRDQFGIPLYIFLSLVIILLATVFPMIVINYWKTLRMSLVIDRSTGIVTLERGKEEMIYSLGLFHNIGIKYRYVPLKGGSYQLYLIGEKGSCQLGVQNFTREGLIQQSKPITDFLNIPIYDIDPENILESEVQKWTLVDKRYSKIIIWFIVGMFVVQMILSFFRINSH